MIENNKKTSFDIDIDFANRDQLLNLIKHIPASILRNGKLIKHNTGIYVADIPVDPITGWASLDYQEAENLGYIKLDLLNVSVYQQVKNEKHLLKLLNTVPRWDMLKHREFVEQVVHINNHYNSLSQMPEPVDSITRMSMFLAIIRPAKKYLIGKPWKEVSQTVWEKPTDGSYAYKMSHAVSYAHLVAVHMNLLCEV